MSDVKAATGDDDPLGSPLPGSGCCDVFPFGAQRDAAATKGAPSLIPPSAIRRLAVRFADGADKYGRGNWLRGIPLSRFADAIIRHTLAAMEGDESEDHLAAVMWNAAAWMETEERIQRGELPAELEDRLYVRR